MTSEFRQRRDRLRDATVKMAKEAGLTPSSLSRATPRSTRSDQRAEDGGRRDGALHPVVVSAVKIPKYSSTSELQGPGILELEKFSAASARVSTGVSSGFLQLL